MLKKAGWILFFSLLVIFAFRACNDLFDYSDETKFGYCEAHERYIPNEELYDIAIESLFDRLMSDPPDWYDTERSDIISYQSVSHFKKINPLYNKSPFRRDDFVGVEDPEEIEFGIYELGPGGDQFVFRTNYLRFGAFTGDGDTDGTYSVLMNFCGEILNDEFEFGLRPTRPGQKRLRKLFLESQGGE